MARGMEHDSGFTLGDDEEMMDDSSATTWGVAFRHPPPLPVHSVPSNESIQFDTPLSLSDKRKSSLDLEKCTDAAWTKRMRQNTTASTGSGGSSVSGGQMSSSSSTTAATHPHPHHHHHTHGHTSSGASSRQGVPHRGLESVSEDDNDRLVSDSSTSQPDALRNGIPSLNMDERCNCLVDPLEGFESSSFGGRRSPSPFGDMLIDKQQDELMSTVRFLQSHVDELRVKLSMLAHSGTSNTYEGRMLVHSVMDRLFDADFDYYVKESESLTFAPILTDPAMPDNPIVLASKAFCDLTRYEPWDILGINTRCLFCPETSPHDVRQLHQHIERVKGSHSVQMSDDLIIRILNQKRDGR
mmetsp:Transcript_15869/g.45211  ORF Transcript_15869/g.45211 Transcript_15869/m.45211 type:complete len:355 (+) Transcript_15869:173-1237(+)